METDGEAHDMGTEVRDTCPWTVRFVQETSPNSLRRPTPVHECHTTPCHNVDGLSGRGLMTSEYGQTGDKRRRTVNDVTALFEANTVLWTFYTI